MQYQMDRTVMDSEPKIRWKKSINNEVLLYHFTEETEKKKLQAKFPKFGLGVATRTSSGQHSLQLHIVKLRVRVSVQKQAILLVFRSLPQFPYNTPNGLRTLPLRSLSIHTLQNKFYHLAITQPTTITP